MVPVRPTQWQPGLEACHWSRRVHGSRDVVRSGGRTRWSARSGGYRSYIAYELGDIAHQSLGQPIRMGKRNQMTAGDLISVEAKSSVATHRWKSAG